LKLRKLKKSYRKTKKPTSVSSNTKKTGAYRGLMAAVINRALADLGKNRTVIKTSPRIKDEAMAWINGPDCEAYCLALDTDYRAVREKAVVLYQRFLEMAENREKTRGRPRRSGTGAGKPRPTAKPENGYGVASKK
jgi:hypothetical protein